MFDVLKKAHATFVKEEKSCAKTPMIFVRAKANCSRSARRFFRGH
jgi:hypothetical protein